MTLSSPLWSREKPAKIAIIKADDIRKITPRWQRFFKLSREKGVKVSAGIICDSLDGEKPDYVKWLRALKATGEVEFWNHGWDHKRWTTDDKTAVSEFKGSGYVHQKTHFEDAQRLMKTVLGSAPVAFGTPYNAADSDTVRVMNENTDMRLFFSYGAKGLENKILAPMSLRGENDGTGKPNAEAFKVAYKKKKGLTFTAIQFHPNGFGEKHLTEYAEILDFLLAEGWTFVLPSDYVQMVDKLKKKP